MQLQAGSPSSLESASRSYVPCMDGERPTIIKGVKPMQGTRPADGLQTTIADDPTIRQRCIAGLCFGAAAALPGFLVLACSSGNGRGVTGGWETLAALLLMPAVVAGLCGAWLGGSILSDTAVDADGKAFKTGARVTLFSMIGIAAVIATMVVGNSHSDNNPMTTWLGTFLSIALCAVIFTGWFLIPFGGLVGCLLRCCSVSDRRWAPSRKAAPYTSSPAPRSYTGNRTLSFPAASLPVSPEHAGSLTNCPGCQRIVSRAAARCPRCGHGV